jgi:putative spermidine/putrescine transport system permease protein
MSDRWKIALLLAPALSVIFLLFFGGMGFGAARSLNFMPLIGLESPNFDAYLIVLTSKSFYQSALLTAYISTVSTLLSCIIAIWAALILRRNFFGRSIANFLFQINLTVPHLVGAIGILYLFSQSGFFARLAQEFHLINQPGDFPAMIYDPFAMGIILQYVWKEVPFITVIILANMQSFGNDYESVARSLGANRWQGFRFVLFPMILPGLLSAAMIVFAFTFGAYEIPALLGQNHPASLPVLAYDKFTEVDLGSRPEAMALAMIIAVLSGAMVLGYAWATRRRFQL